MKRILIILQMYVAGLQTVPVFSAPVQHLFEKANRFYEAQEFDSAAAYYEKSVEAGANADVYYNLGNSYYRLKKIGLAILYYEKALKLAPNDSDILANIRFANLNIIDRIPLPEQTLLTNLLQRLHTLLPLNTQLWVLFGLLSLVAILFSASLFVSYNPRLWLLYMCTLTLILVLSLGFSVGVKIYDNERTEYAIVLEKSVDAINEPNGTTVIFTAHEGTKFRIRKRVDEWALVSLPNGVSGWVSDKVFGEI